MSVISAPSKQTFAEKRTSYASTLLHTLYWALNNVGATQENNQHHNPIKYSSQLLGMPHENEIGQLQTIGLEEFMRQARWLQMDGEETRGKRFARTPIRIARAPLSYLQRTPGTDCILLSSAVLFCGTQTSLGGFSHDRSAYTKLTGIASSLLGQATTKLYKLRDKNPSGLFQQAREVIEKYQLPSQPPIPEFLKTDATFIGICNNIRWMNPFADCLR